MLSAINSAYEYNYQIQTMNDLKPSTTQVNEVENYKFHDR